MGLGLKANKVFTHELRLMHEEGLEIRINGSKDNIRNA